ncbi:hypothetical protein LIA77_10902 [Sarocladium implicatum]|nr:hypothetical protein LIA77_10902 [Sarocladium implicatum]
MTFVRKLIGRSIQPDRPSTAKAQLTSAAWTRIYHCLRSASLRLLASHLRMNIALRG